MRLVRWQPFSELNTLTQEMDRLFDQLSPMSKLTGLDRQDTPSWVPAVEIKATEVDVILRAEIPGVAAEDLDVQVMRDRVLISGEHRQKQQSEAKGYLRSEFRYGQFRRVVPLPAEVQNDQVQAEFADGILMLTLPKAEAERRKVFKVDLTRQLATNQPEETPKAQTAA